MTRPVLLDTGPLVAILSSRDEHHETCVQQLKELETPLLTCWPVLTEAAWLLRNQANSLELLLRGVEKRLYRLLALDDDALTWATLFMRRYHDLSPQLADACLVYLAEFEGSDTIFTLDRRDFSVYRLSRGRSFTLLPEG